LRRCTLATCESDFNLECEAGQNPLLVKRDGFGLSNVGVYLEDACQRMNARRVCVSAFPYKIDIRTIEPDDVDLDLVYTDSNSCAVPDGKLKPVCRPGTTEACIFLTCGAGGFTCEKFNSPMARLLLDRFEKGEMRATRIGNCRLVGRAA
jgi:hypothetical protein